jgi:hypothetical protein
MAHTKLHMLHGLVHTAHTTNTYRAHKYTRRAHLAYTTQPATNKTHTHTQNNALTLTANTH